MRTALLLLLLLAVAAVPGSVFPQRSIDAGRTSDWIAAHSTIGPILDRLGMFSVYSTPWFAAIYLLLFISLSGCLLPRCVQHWRSLRRPPPKAPRNLSRLPESAISTSPCDEAAARAKVARSLRSRRFRVAVNPDGSISAEKGYLRETGNLVFHLALLALIVGVAIGHLWGWRADIIVPEGQSFTNTATRYDTPIKAGPLVDSQALSPFVVQVTKMVSSFNEAPQGRGQFGQPRAFSAEVTWAARAGAATQQAEIQVNHPLEMDGATIYLLGNGYAPVVTVRDARGQVLYTGATAFLAQDNNYKSVGAIKVPAARPKQLGLVGLFLPTAYIDSQLGPSSAFPDTKAPALALSLYEGNLFPDGRPQSVFTLDTAQLSKVVTGSGAKADSARIWLTPGQTIQLPGGRGSIRFDGVSRFAGFSVRHDPGKWLILGSAVTSLAGLILALVIKRRRVFARLTPLPGGQCQVELGSLLRDDDDSLRALLLAVLKDADGAAVRGDDGSVSGV